MKKSDEFGWKSDQASTDTIKHDIFAVLRWDNLGLPHIEKAFSDYFMCREYIDQQRDNYTYTIEKCVFVESQLPF